MTVSSESTPPQLPTLTDKTPAGIKKREHKLLDYDAMRAKVKKLTEKPDKDPGKLPRTEKETEMVSMKDFLNESSSFLTVVNTTNPSAGAFEYDLEADLMRDLEVPSPPKALQRPEIQKLKRAEKSERVSSMEFCRSPNMMSRVVKVKSPRLGSEPNEAILQRSTSAMIRSTVDSSVASSRESDEICSSTVNLLQHAQGIAISPSRAFSMPASPTSSSISTATSGQANSRHSSKPTNRSVGASRSGSGLGRSPFYLPTPFFQPSELEEIMQPLRAEFMKREADMLSQAKAAYEQLNEQLTTELPQLIDLR